MKRAVYKPLKLIPVSREECFVPKQLNLPSVSVDSPALHVMTDLNKIPAATIFASATLSEANQAMIHRGVRLLFVTDTAQHLLGVITATDLLGEKPMQVSQKRDVRREELLVDHLMTPVENMEAVSMMEVSHAEVGHIVSTLKEAGRQHAIVIEQDAAGQQMLRGIFSSSQLARQLGIQISTVEVAQTFAEIEAAIARA